MPTSIKIADLNFEVRTAGKPENELVIFLHGFPETSIMWKAMIEDISERGFYCIAPNMRGYSKDACPKGKKNYAMSKLVQDVLDIADSAGKEKFHLVGHDWGALVGWNLVFHHHKKVISWTALSVPHLNAFAKALKTDEDQKKKSGYIKLFMIPFLPEMRMRKYDFEQFKKIWRNSSEEEVEDYLSVFRNKKCLTAALNYYRANFGSNRPKPIDKIDTPTLFLWGKAEKYIGETAADLCKEYMSGDFDYVKLDGGHWLVQTDYTEVKNHLEKHLSKYKLS